MNKIKLGYEIGTGREVDIPISHLIVTGLTQMAGKTTALESFIKRSNRRAIVFRTKIGEKSFLAGTIIPPYFKDRSDWKFIKGILESTNKMRIDKYEQATIIKLCKKTGGNSLVDFKKKVDQRLTEKISTTTEVTLTNLQAYLEEVLPKLTTIQFSKSLELVDGLNIVDLERFSRDSEVQGLIIASILEEVLYNFKDTTVILPEAWKYIPQERGSPCKIIVDEFIRQGATNNNYLWIDSQDMSGVDKTPLKQISEWVLGYQSERNEVKHTLDQIPLPKTNKPKEDEIMTLGKGIFIVATREFTKKVYIQPFWLDDERSIKIAMGELKIEDLDVKPEYTHNEIKVLDKSIKVDDLENDMKKELNEMRVDFFSKLNQMQSQISIMSQNIHEFQNKNASIDESSIIGKILQKIQVNQPIQSVNIDEIVRKVIDKIPIGGNNVFKVEPLEMLRKEFLQECKNKIIEDIKNLPNDSKRMLLYLESVGKDVSTNELVVRCFFIKSNQSAINKVSKASIGLKSVDFVIQEKKGLYRTMLKEKIKQLLEPHGGIDDDVKSIYDHIINDLLVTKEIVV